MPAPPATRSVPSAGHRIRAKLLAEHGGNPLEVEVEQIPLQVAGGKIEPLFTICGKGEGNLGVRHGQALDGVLFVVTTLRGEDVCRIISARRATRHEEDRYYAGDQGGW